MQCRVFSAPRNPELVPYVQIRSSANLCRLTMATDNGPTWLAIVDNQVDQLIASWHTYRVGLCAITLDAVGLVLAWRGATGNWPSRTSERSPAPDGKAPRARRPEGRREQKEPSGNED